MDNPKTIVDAEKLIEFYKKTLFGLNNTLLNIEKEINKVKQTIDKLSFVDFDNIDKFIENNKIKNEDVLNIIEGEFDGVVLVDKEGNKYPVPTNYASKTQLVSGDKMKLHIMKDGRMLFKLIEKTKRQTIYATLSKDEKNNKDIAIYKNKYIFLLNHASVLYHKGKPGDKILIAVNKEKPGKFGALLSIVSKT